MDHLGTSRQVHERLAEDSDELEAEQRLHSGQHDPCLSQHLRDSLLQRGVFRHGLFTRRYCPFFMAGLQPAQIFKRVPETEGQNSEEEAGSQTRHKAQDALAGDEKSDSQAERERQQCARRHAGN